MLLFKRWAVIGAICVASIRWSAMAKNPANVSAARLPPL